MSDRTLLLSAKSFEIAMWTLSGFSTFFLATGIAVRMHTKGKLAESDYFIVAALPILLVAFGLLQSVLELLYRNETAAAVAVENHRAQSQPPSNDARITAIIELLWIVIYCIKFCFLAQFKFYKPPYAYVDVRLTRYYWIVVGACVVAFLFTLIQPAVICYGHSDCRYGKQSNNVSWETAVTAVDIGTDLLGLLLHIINLSQAHTYINFAFKSLSVFAIAIAATRLALQYDARAHRVNYTTLVFLLAVEAAISIAMSSISSYRVILINYMANSHAKKAPHLTLNRVQGYGREPGIDVEPFRSFADGDRSLAELPILKPQAKASHSAAKALTAVDNPKNERASRYLEHSSAENDSELHDMHTIQASMGIPVQDPVYG